MDGRTDGWQRTWHHLRDALGGKWAFHVLRALWERDHGFNELKRRLRGVTAKTLSRRLSELECAGLVDRRVEATSPPASRYSLTDDGREFVALLRRMEELVDVVDCACRDDCSTLVVGEAVDPCDSRC